jgi:hypothetical protein
MCAGRGAVRERRAASYRHAPCGASQRKKPAVAGFLLEPTTGLKPVTCYIMNRFVVM